MRTHSRRLSIGLGAALLIATLALTGCAGGGPVAGSDPAGAGNAVAPVAPVALPENFPTADVPLLEGAVVSAQYDESPADSTSPYRKWWVTIVPTAGGVDEAIVLLQDAGWTWDEDNHTLADGSDSWLFKDDYSLTLTAGSAGLSYVVNLRPGSGQLRD